MKHTDMTVSQLLVLLAAGALTMAIAFRVIVLVANVLPQ